MSQQKGKNRKPLLIILIAAIVVLAVALTLILTVFNGNQKPAADPAEEDYVLFWNVERKLYSGVSQQGTGMTTREPNKDTGYYHILFASEGRQMQRRVAERRVVNQIDSLDVMGLVFDENNVVVDVLRIEEFTGGYAVNRFYVESFDGTTAIVNSSDTLKGMQQELKVTDKTGIYDVSGESSYVGEKSPTLYEMDCVVAIKNKAGEITHIFVVERQPQGPTQSKYCEHCEEEVLWKAWAYTNSLPLQSGHWYLCEDIQLVGQNSMPEGCKVILDLNGKTVTNHEGNRMYSLHFENTYLAMMDYSEEQTGKFVVKGELSAQGGAVWLRYGQFDLYSGILDASQSVNHLDGTAVALDPNDTVFNMYGGTLIGGTAEAFTKADGGTTGGLGGTLKVWGGEFNFYGGKIIGGYAKASYKNNEYVLGYGGSIALLGQGEKRAIMNMYGGEVLGGRADQQGGNIWKNETSDLYISGGVISGGATVMAARNGGNIYSAGGDIYFSDGEIKNGLTYNCGANIFLGGGGRLHMSGGKIYGGQMLDINTDKPIATDDENLFVVNSVLNMSGGWIEGNVEVLDHMGGKSTITLSGTAQITGAVAGEPNLKLPDSHRINVGTLSEGAKIGVTAIGVFTNETEQSNAKYFTVDNSNTTIGYSDKCLSVGEVIYNCICGHAHTEADPGVGACDGKKLAWVAWPRNNHLPEIAGNWYLTGDVHAERQYGIRNSKLNLSLNGYSVYKADGVLGRILRVDSGTVYNLTNWGKTTGGKFINANGFDTGDNGAAILVHNYAPAGQSLSDKPVMSIYDVTVSAVDGDKVAINTRCGSAIMLSSSTLNLYTGAQVIGGEASIGGGAIYVNNEETVLNIDGGKIIGGRTVVSEKLDENGQPVVDKDGNKEYIVGGHGGALYVKGTVNLISGSIEGGYGNFGGNVKIDTTGTLNMTGGTITGGVAEKDLRGEGGHGGNIYVVGTLNVTGGTIDDGYAEVYGGNYYFGAGHSNFDGITVSGGTSDHNGGNMQIASGEVTFTDCVIKDGIALNDSPNINMNGGILTLDGCTVSGGDRNGDLDWVTGNALFIDGKVILKDSVLEGRVSAHFGNLTLMGTVKIHDGENGLRLNSAYREAEKSIILDESFDAENSDILLTEEVMSYTHYFATGATEDSKNAFSILGGSSDDISYVVEDGVGYLYIGKFHCLCGHAHTEEDPAVGECDGTQLHWMPINDLSSVKDGGYYYLVSDLGDAEDTNSGVVGVNFTSGKVHLDLNGHNIYVKTPTSEEATSDRLFHINGAEVVFTDATDTPGKLIIRGEGEHLGGGACFFIRQTDDAAPTKVTLYNIGLDVSASTAIADGAAILFNGGELNLHNITVTGAATAPSDIYVGGGKLLMDNVTVNGNVKLGDADVTLSSTVKIGNGTDKGLILLDGFKQNNKSLALVDFNSTESSILLIGAMGYHMPIAAQAASEDGFVLPTGSDADVILIDDALFIGKYNCVCGGDHADGAPYGGCDGTKQLWLPVSGFPSQSGYYYLTDDIGNADDATSGRSGAGADGLYLDLNGHKIFNTTEAVRMMHVSGTRKLVFTDLSGNPGGFVIRGNDASLGGGALFFTLPDDSGASINLYNVTIDTSAIAVTGEKDSDDGMAVLLMGGELNMYGVTVNGNVLGVSDLRINAGKANIVDCTINGRVLVVDGEVNVAGTTINGKTAGYGASMYIMGGNVKIDDSTLNGGRADTGNTDARGGNLYINGGVVTITDTTISGGYCTGNGGNVNVQAGNVTMTNCKILNGTSAGDSGNLNMQSGSLILDGCTVSGGTCGNAVSPNMLLIDGNVTIKDTAVSGGVSIVVANVTLKGKVSIHDGNLGLYIRNQWLDNDKVLTLDSTFDADNSDILLTGDMFGSKKNFAVGAVPGSEEAFALTDNYDADIVLTEGKLYVGKYSCICGNEHVGGAAYGGCDGVKHVWFPVSDLNSAKDGGYYYLTADLNMGHTAITNCTINLSLNGHNIIGGGIRLFRVDTGANITFTNWNLTEGGKIINTIGFAGLDNGAVFLLHNYQPEGVDYGYPTVNLYNIAVVASEGNASAANCNNGGAIAVNNGTLNVYGGKINGCDAVNGDAVYVAAQGSVYMLDATVNGVNGSAIYANSGSNNVKLINTQINGETVVESGYVRFENASVKGDVILNGGNTTMHSSEVDADVFFNSGELTLSGAMKVQNGSVKVAGGKYIAVADTFDGDASQVSVDAIGKFAEGAASAKGFVSVNVQTGTGVSMAENGDLYIGELIRACMCGTTHVVGSHCDGVVYEWLAWPYNDRLPESGNWYLTGDVTISGQLGLNGKTLNLSLNGFNITSNAADRVLQLQNGSLVNLTNWGKTTGGQLINRNTFSGDGGVILVHDVGGSAAAPVLNLYGITINGAGTTINGNGGALAVGDRATVNAFNCSFSNFTANYGGLISVQFGGTLNLVDSSVSDGGSARDPRSANIFVKDATLKMTGSTQVTGGILVETTGTTTVYVDDTVHVTNWQGGITLDKLEQTVTIGSNFTGSVCISGYGVIATGTSSTTGITLGHNNGQLVAGENLIYVGRASDGAYAWPYANSLPASGNWYLLNDVSAENFAVTGDLKLDLNGKTITGTIIANNVALELGNGTVSGNVTAGSLKLENMTAAGAAQSVNVTLVGNVNVSELFYVPGTTVLDYSGMNLSASSVKLSFPEAALDSVVVLNNVNPSILQAFSSANSDYALLLEGNKTAVNGNVYLRPATARINCICGHAHTDADPGVGACDGTTVTWYCWTSTITLPDADGKHYYLSDNVTVGGYDRSSGSMYLDLNSYNVYTYDTAIRLFHVNGATVVITDTTANPGSLIPVDGNLGGGAIMMINNSASNVSLYNIKLDVSATTHTAEGTALLFNAGTLNLYNVEVSGNGQNNVIRVAGNNFLLDNSTVNGQVKLVSGNVTLSGAVQIGQLYFDNNFKTNGNKVALVDFDGANSNVVVVNVAGSGNAFATGAAGADGVANNAGFTVPADTDADIVRINGELYVGKYNCVCGGDHTNGAYGGCDGTKHLWLPVSSFPGQSGYYYLTGDLGNAQDLTSGHSGAGADGLYLDLNGHKIYNVATTVRMMHVSGNRKLVFTDLSGNPGGFVIRGDVANLGGGALFFTLSSDTGANINLYNLFIDTSAITAQNGGDGDDGMAVLLMGGQLNMYGVTVNGNNLGCSDIRINAGKATFKDCTINGRVFIANGEVEMTDSAVNGKTASSGASMYIAGGDVTITGCEISGGRADTGNADARGGNLYISSGNVTVTNTTIDGGYSSGRGGNIFVCGGIITMTDCTISNGVSYAQGGNIAAEGSSLTLYSCDVIDGVTTNNSGRDFFMQGGSVYMYGGTVSGNTSSAPAMWMNAGTFTVSEYNGEMPKLNSGRLQMYTTSPTIVLKGKVEVDHIYLSENTRPGSLIVGQLDVDGSIVKVGSAIPANALASGLTTDVSGAFTSVDSAYVPVCMNGELKLMPKWNGTQTAGTYFLTGNVELTSTVTLTGDLTLYLNGHKITAASNLTGAMFKLDSCNLTVNGGNLDDCQLVTGANVTSMIQAVNGSVNLNGVKMLAYVDNGGNNTQGIAVSATKSAITMQGSVVDARGNISTATGTAGTGSAIYLHFASGGASSLSLTDCTIIAGTAYRGASVFNEMSSITMTNSVMLNGTATNQGGNIYMAGNQSVGIAATLVMNAGSSIKGGTASSDGGNIYANSAGTITMHAGSEISGGTGAAGDDIALAMNGIFTIANGATLREPVGLTSSANATYIWVHPAYLSATTIMDNRV